MDVITGLAYGLLIMLVGSAGLVAFALYLKGKDRGHKKGSDETFLHA